jgi:hypothetical protein
LKRAWIALLAPLVSAFAASAQDWPRVALPRDVRSFDIAREITHNAMPMRLQGFVSDTPPDRMVELFRQSMGSPLVESRLGARHILGRAEGEFYVSVQIEAAGRGSRGTIAVTHLKTAHDAQEAALRRRDEWVSRLPPGSRVLSETSSRDGARSSQHIVFANTQGEAANRERLTSLLRQDGLALEWEGAPGNALFFKGRAKDAMATIHQGSDGQTTVVLNVVTQLRGPK